MEAAAYKSSNSAEVNLAVSINVFTHFLKPANKPARYSPQTTPRGDPAEGAPGDPETTGAQPTRRQEQVELRDDGGVGGGRHGVCPRDHRPDAVRAHSRYFPTFGHVARGAGCTVQDESGPAGRNLAQEISSEYGTRHTALSTEDSSRDSLSRHPEHHRV